MMPLKGLLFCLQRRVEKIANLFVRKQYRRVQTILRSHVGEQLRVACRRAVQRSGQSDRPEVACKLTGHQIVENRNESLSLTHATQAVEVAVHDCFGRIAVTASQTGE